MRRRILADKYPEFDAWSRSIAESCRQFKGHTGTRVIKPHNPENDIITIISFDSYENFLVWENSDERNHWLEQIAGITISEGDSEYIKGFDYWLEEKSTWPPKFRMVFIAYLAIWPLVYFVDPLLIPFMPQNALVASLLKTFIITVLMGYASLPLMSRIFRRFL